jgi:hypothetical protein
MVALALLDHAAAGDSILGVVWREGALRDTLYYLYG